jgi:hypothetical protein
MYALKVGHLFNGEVGIHRPIPRCLRPNWSRLPKSDRHGILGGTQVLFMFGREYAKG